MKRIISLILIIFILCSFAYSAPILNENISSGWDGFELSAVPDGSSMAEVTSNGLKLGFSTSEEEGYAKATKLISVEGDVFVMTATISVSATDSSNQRKITLKDRDTASKTCDLINVKGDTLYAFGTKVEVLNVEPEAFYTVTVAADNVSKSGAVWYDGECIYSDNLGTTWKSFDFSNLMLEIRNYTFPKTSTMESEFLVSELIIDKNAVFKGTYPEDGDNFVEAATEGEINLMFDGMISPSMLKKENYILTENDAYKEFSVSKNDGLVCIIPDGGFNERCEYKLTILKVTDLLNTVYEENKVLTFSTASAGYEKAQIRIECSEAEIFEGESASIKVIVYSGTLENLCITENGEVVKEFSGLGPYEYILSKDEGTYVIGAYGTDEFGGKAVAEDVEVIVYNNENPEISSSLTDGGAYSKAFLEKLEIQANDSDGSISKVEAYLDGTLYDIKTSAPYVFNFSSVISGRHTVSFTATDNHNKKAEISYEILIEGDINLMEKNFWDMSSGSGMTLNKAGGSEDFIYTEDYEEYTEEHGFVAEFTTGTDGKGNQCYVIFPTSQLVGKFQVEMDIYADFTGGGQLMLLQRQSNMANTSHEISIYPTSIQFRTKNGGEYKRADFQQKMWHHIIYTINHYDNTYSFSMDGEVLVKDVPFQNSTIEGPAELRGIAQFAKDQRVRFLFDNLRLSIVDEEPVIKSVGYDETAEAEKVSPYAKVLNLNLSAAIDKSITTDNIILKQGGNNVQISGISCEKNIVKVSLDEPLDSQTEYTAVLSGLKTVAGTSVAGSINISFKTDYYNADLEGLSIGNRNKVSGKLINKLEDNKIYFVVVTSFSGEKMKDITVKQITAQNGENLFTTDSVEKSSGDTLNVSVWDSLSEPIVYTVKKFN